MVLAVALLRKNAWDYIAHLSVLQLIGVLFLLPAIGVLIMFPFAGLVTAIFCVAFSSTFMFLGHRQRIEVLGYSKKWTISWALFLAVSAITTLLVFTLKHS
jgi:hypothetical protein